eukprot:TRINITY_DN7754_c0_g1_i1.p1 TRINITY_DN7754_c0_g1~~TRINITY_DN7754_c0_g1_i1.p1  ORF type:complete len:232 (+),score=23.86 TRINITY_DN7754_c0_g1_i1:92-787(+)
MKVVLVVCMLSLFFGAVISQTCSFYYRQTDFCVNPTTEQYCNQVTVSTGSNCARSAVNLFPGTGSYRYNCTSGQVDVYSDLNCSAMINSFTQGDCSQYGNVSITIGSDNNVCGLANLYACTVTIEDCTNRANCESVTISSRRVCYSRTNYPGGYISLSCATRTASFHSTPDCSYTNTTVNIPIQGGCVNSGYGYSYSVNYGSSCAVAPSPGVQFYTPGAATNMKNWINKLY